MKPRVFVSSTYYDLKYIRESIQRFISKFGFETVLFEDGNVHFEHGKPLDISCYKEIQHCHMMILIIGGRYGSMSSENDPEEFMQQYENNYISITRKEFKTARSKDIPIYIFIDKNVYAEYITYSKNQTFFKEKRKNNDGNYKFEFAHVDSENIFEFIDEVKFYALKTFERFEDIEEYLLNQWSGMFYNYLTESRKNDNEKVLNSVNELQSITEKMNEMLDSIGKNVLKKSGQYEDVLDKQTKKHIEFYTKRIVDILLEGFNMSKYFKEINELDIFALSESIFNDFLKYDNAWYNGDTINDFEFFLNENIYEELADIIIPSLSNFCVNIEKNGTKLFKFHDLFKIYESKIKPIIEKREYEIYFKEMLETKLKENIENSLAWEMF